MTAIAKAHVYVSPVDSDSDVAPQLGEKRHGTASSFNMQGDMATVAVEVSAAAMVISPAALTG
jgi:hypothetical protein